MTGHRVLVLIALFVLAGCKGASKAPGAMPPVSVRVAAATRMDVPVTITASGIVEPFQTVSVQAQVSGALLGVHFREGDDVRAGQLLFQMDVRSIEAAVAQARAALARDEAQAEAARRSDERYQALVKQDYVARDQADQIHAAALAAAATVEADRAVLRAATVNLSYTTIRSPIAGRTGALIPRVGDIVGPESGPLVVINQLQPIRVRFPVLSSDLNLLRSAVATHALPATVTATDSTPITEVGQLAFLDNAVDSATGAVTGKASFQNRANGLWPGQLVVLTVRAGTDSQALVVPTAAIQIGQQGGYVYVVDSTKMTVQLRSVTVGRSLDSLTVVSSGLSDGELVVTDGQSLLTPGGRVAIRNGASGSAADSSASPPTQPAAPKPAEGTATGVKGPS